VLSRVLGIGMPKVLIVSSATFVIVFLFSIYSFATYFKIDVWDFQDRVSYYSYFNSYLISPIIDHLIISLFSALWLASSLKHSTRFAIATIYGITAFVLALWNQELLLAIIAIISMPTIILLLILNLVSSKKFLISDRNLVINYFAIIGIGTGLLSLLISLEPLYFPDNELTELRSIAYEIFLIFSGLSPILLITLILSLPVKIIIDGCITAMQKTKIRFFNSMTLSSRDIQGRTRLLFLILFVIFADLMVIIPHQDVINKTNTDVGVDTHYYVDEIKALRNSTSTDELFHKIFVDIQHGDRAFTLLFFFTITKIVHSNNFSLVFDYVPILLGPLLVLAVYFLTRELTSNDIASLLSAFITAISFHTLVGIYAGSYANWLALVVGYLSIVFVLRSLKKTNKLNVIVFLVLINITLFTHIYTWSILSLVIGIFLLVLLKTKYYERRTIIILLLVLLSSVFIDMMRTLVTGVYSGLGYDISPPTGSIVELGPEQFSMRWRTLVDSTLSYLGSIFGNVMIYALGLYWLIRSKIKNLSTIFIITFLSIGIIPLFLGNWIVQARVFYDIPFQIPAAIALTYLYQRRSGSLIVIAVCIWLITMSIRAVSNFYLIAPN